MEATEKFDPRALSLPALSHVVVEDLGSTNGCLLNGARVGSTSMNDQDYLLLGAVEPRVCARSALFDHAPGVSHATFMRMATDEVARARLVGRCVSVLALKHDEQRAERPIIHATLKLEVRLIQDALAETEGNQAQAARLLGVPRRTMTSKMQVYGIARRSAKS